MPEPAPATAIVLAGGRSSRFGSEKLAVEVEGAPLLHHAVRGVASVCKEVLVVGAPSGLPVRLPDGLASVPVVVLDVEAYQGPLVALMAAAESATHDRLLVVGGDMPSLVPAVLARLLRWDDAADGVCLVADGWVQPFPMGLDREASLARGSEIVGAGERSMRSLIDALSVELVLEDEWRELDPEARSLRDIDRPEGLA
jgi:molybdopterin-guanine dinucleotide biosynthesis protein A